MLPALIPGVNSNSGTPAMQAIVTANMSTEDLPNTRNSASAIARMGTGSKGDSYSIAQNELVVMDSDVTRPGMVPAVFSSLTGLDFDPRFGDAGLAKRMVPLGVAITRINYASASGLFEQKVTVVTNGLVPLRWVSEEIRSPMPGDLFCAYPPKTDPVARHHQLTTVSENSSGSRYHGDILGDVRTPMLMKKFTGAEIDDLIIDALDMFVQAPMVHLNKAKDAEQRSLSPVENVLYNVVLGLAKMKFQGDENALSHLVVAFWGSYMTTQATIAFKKKVDGVPLTAEEGDEIKSAAAFAGFIRSLLTSYRVAINATMSSVVGRIVGNRIDGTVPVYLG